MAAAGPDAKLDAMGGGAFKALFNGNGKAGFESVASPTQIKVLYKAEMSEKWPLMQACCGGLFCKEKLMDRTGVSVLENGIMTSYPMLMCCGLCICDATSVRLFDRSNGKFQNEKLCTPFHCLCFLPLCGEVAKDPLTDMCKIPWLNPCCMPCNPMVPGLADAETFAKEANQAWAAWNKAHGGGSTTNPVPEGAASA